MGHESNSTPSTHQTNPLASSLRTGLARHDQSEAQLKLGRVLAYIISLAHETPPPTEPPESNAADRTDVEQGDKDANAR